MAIPNGSLRPPRLGITRIALATLGAWSVLTAASRPAEAQVAAEATPSWQLVVPAGKLIPMGAQRDVLASAGVTAVQLSYVVRPTLAVTGTLGWARSRDIAAPNHPKLDVFLFDIGTEVRAPRWIAYRALTLSPFAGVGGGVRAYNRRSQDMITQSVTAYGAAGAELGVRRVRLRVEARDYLSGLEARNDVAIMFGVRIAS